MVAADRHANSPPSVRAQIPVKESKRYSHSQSERTTILRMYLPDTHRGSPVFIFRVICARDAAGSGFTRTFAADSHVGISACYGHACRALWQRIGPDGSLDLSAEAVAGFSFGLPRRRSRDPC